jgi:hypothetical protein
VNACLDTLVRERLPLADTGRGRLLSTVPGSLPETARSITDVVHQQPNLPALNTLADSAANGRLTVRVAETLPWEEFRRGYHLLRRWPARQERPDALSTG